MPLRRIAQLENENEQLRASNEALQEELMRIEYAHSLTADLCDASTVGLVAMGADRVVVAANRAAVELLETAHHELIGTSMDLLLLDASLLTFQAHLPERPTFQGHTALVGLRHRPAKRVRITTVTRPDADLGLLHLLAIEDMTQLNLVESSLQEYESRLRAVLSSTTEAVVTLTWEGRIESFNPTAEAMFGYPAAEALGMFIVRILPEIDVVVDSPAERLDMTAVRRDGSLLDVIVSSTPLRTESMFVRVLTIQDISDWRKLQREILLISEREQRRMGRDLHDGISQQLAGVGYMTRVMQRRLAQQKRPEAGDMLRIVNLVQETQEHVRALTRSLYPAEVERHGLNSALAVLAETVSNRSNVNCRFHSQGDRQLPDEQSETNLYRIAQEAVSNAVRHGQAQEIDIDLLWRDQEMVLRVSDNGSGFASGAQSTGGLGLRIMRERAHFVGGRFEVRSAPGEGTTVTVRVARGSSAQAQGALQGADEPTDGD